MTILSSIFYVFLMYEYVGDVDASVTDHIALSKIFRRDSFSS